MSAVEYGVLKKSPKALISECLRGLDEGITGMVERTEPDAVALEGAFFSKNARTAMILGQARGVAIAASARCGLPVYEYAPRRVKQALVGFGSAGKEQVRKMVMTILGLTEEPAEDAGDALAIAVCHLHNVSGHAALGPKEI